ncbi:ABSCISIC ACID-INSENSITIVE 5-like protein 2 [Cynara cardunculus var. scolymus]|uniref:ABSCISIC ACID-INSENSITIVE 5-like protein 2 n=1 Tax=Cynara cardunculus var. scolymus TaxID=59895 RepID=UPI000D625198|nr:ABSCISIC ACID-INSENSITIVE 5-like protein 2 [Cynara cardunculus var. scolymus]
MGIQTMGSNGGTQKPMLDGLARQGSLYNLTLDEVQQQLGDLGKPLSSMNLDELLKSVWTAEANQGMNNGPFDHTELTQLASASSLPRQLSLSLATDLTKKTVDEVWQDIQEGQKKKKKDTDDNDINIRTSFKDFGRKGSRERQPTLGEMTLEDFLVKAGVVAESSPGKKKQVLVIGVEPIGSQDTQEAQWMQYQVTPIQQQHVVMPGHYQVQPSLAIAANPVMEMGYPETHMTMSPTPLMGGLSDAHLAGRKRVASGVVIEKTVERRQKRMIKNRESAARSRARKQAYTHELENKVSRLEEENERLRRQKEVEKVLPSVPPPETKYQLRRTTSSPF